MVPEHVLRITNGAILVLAGLSGSALSAPRVVKTVPADGATDVDPATTQIVVTFDSPMKTDGFTLRAGRR